MPEDERKQFKSASSQSIEPEHPDRGEQYIRSLQEDIDMQIKVGAHPLMVLLHCDMYAAGRS